MVDTSGNHYALVVYTRKEEVESVLYVDEDKNKEDLVSYKEVKKAHKVNNHKRKEQMIHTYNNAGLMRPEVVNRITRLVNDCKICPKFPKSVSRPRVTLPNSTDFSQVVMMDLKGTGNKFILWMICSFTKFMLGTLIPKK